MDTTELQNLLVFTKKSFTQEKETSFVEHMWKRPLFQCPPKAHQQPGNSTARLWRQIFPGDSLNWREQKQCSSHQSNALRRFSHLCTAESMKRPLHHLTHCHASKGHAVLLVLDPSCKDPVQMPRAVLGHAPAFVSKPVLACKEKGLHFVGS